MCEETEREGQGLENKCIYVLLLFVILGGQWYAAVLTRSVFLLIK